MGCFEGKSVSHAGEFFKQSWTFGFGSLDNAIAETVNQTIEDEFIKNPPTLWFPIVWGGEGDGFGGPAPDNPLTMYLSLEALGDAEFQGPAWSFDLERMLCDLAFGNLNKETLEIELPIAFAVRDKLQALVAKIEESINAIQSIRAG